MTTLPVSIEVGIHTATHAITGVGSVRRLSAVRWRVVGRIVWAWGLTIPALAVVGAILCYAMSAVQRLIR